jgi:hypothetical protein
MHNEATIAGLMQDQLIVTEQTQIYQKRHKILLHISCTDFAHILRIRIHTPKRRCPTSDKKRPFSA